MTSVATILSIASKVSALRASAGEPENDIALAALNKTYQRACLDCELTGADASYTATASATAIAASAVAGADVMRLQHLRVVSSQTLLPLQQVSRQELQDYRAVDDSESVPQMYSVAFVNGVATIDFFPGIAQGDVIKMSYLAAPATLTTATTAITHMPEMFHHDILTNAVIAALMERDGGKQEEAQMYLGRSLEGMVRLEEYLGQMGAVANRAYIAPMVGRPSYPDSRFR